MIHKLGGLWWDGDRLIADPVISAFSQYVEKHGLPKFILDEALKHNPLLASLNAGKNAKDTNR